MNDSDDKWSGWINIDAGKNNLNNSASYNDFNYFNNEDSVFFATYISENTIECDWLLSPGNGNKKINIEIMTVLGITQPVVINLFKNQEETKYNISLYSAYSNGIFSEPVNLYQGKYIVSSLTGPIHVKLSYYDNNKINSIFNLVKSLNKFNGYYQTDLNGNIVPSISLIQQGINHQLNIPMEFISEGIYHGVINIFNNDGVFNIDGLASLLINTPDPSVIYHKIQSSNNMSLINQNSYYTMRTGQFKFELSPENLNPEYIQSLIYTSRNNLIKEVVPYDQSIQIGTTIYNTNQLIDTENRYNSEIQEMTISNSNTLYNNDEYLSFNGEK
jgi:hypothetical protein